MSSFPATLLTPEQTLFEGDVQAVILRTADGDATFLPGHTALIGAVVTGRIRFQAEDGSERAFDADSGLVRVEPDGVTVLVPAAAETAE